MKGRLVDIKRLSVYDGPGIRTTIFLKGCTLRCLWCHNPESVEPKPEIGLLKNRCIGCGKCAEVCPVGAHFFRDGIHVFNRETCTACGKCVENCLADALEYYGKTMSASEAAAAVLEDATFYNESGGGCTISGGEPLLQSEFCAEVFELLQRDKIHCAIDTSGAVSWKKFLPVLGSADLFLYDVKHTDENIHRKNTGLSNMEILGNLRRLSETGIPIEIRIPVIPGFNADSESMSAIGVMLKSLKNITLVRLLSYHLARSKYEAVGHQDTMPMEDPPSTAQMESAAEILRDLGLDARRQ